MKKLVVGLFAASFAIVLLINTVPKHFGLCPPSMQKVSDGEIVLEAITAAMANSLHPRKSRRVAAMQYLEDHPECCRQGRDLAGHQLGLLRLFDPVITIAIDQLPYNHGMEAEMVDFSVNVNTCGRVAEVYRLQAG